MVDTYTAIDFKTATERLTSVCQVGIVRIENGKCVEKLSILVQPPNNYYWNSFTKMHHINPVMTEHALHFNVIWREIEPLISNQDVIAANDSTFDCLKQTLEFYKLPVPKYTGHSIYDIYKDDMTSLRKRYKFVSKSDDVVYIAEACADLFELHLKGIN